MSTQNDTYTNNTNEINIELKSHNDSSSNNQSTELNNESHEQTDNNISINYYYKVKPLKVGSTLCLLWFNNYPLITIGPNWGFFLILTSLIISITSCYLYYLWSYLNNIVKYIGVIILIFQVTCHWITALINPGIPFGKYKEIDLSNKNTPLPLNIRYCHECQIVMMLDLDTSHCPECDICCEGLDHHCQWVGKCVGKNNLISFYGFVSGTLIIIVYLLISLMFLKTKY